MEKRFLTLIKYITLCCLLVFIIINSILFWSRFHYQNGIRYMNEKAYDQAVSSFDRAETLLLKLPGFCIAQDLFRIHTQKGMALHELGLELWKENGISARVTAFYKQSKSCLISARQTDPLNYITTYWLARTENALEILSANLFPEENHPFNARPLYEKAIALRPNGISVHHAYIRYLYRKGEFQEIPDLARYMVRIYPPSFYQLKKEPFFNDALMAHLEKGLLSALDDNTAPRQALQALSAIQVEKQDFDKAISLYHDSLEIRPFSNRSGNYIRMGQLYLKTPAREKSIPWFMKGLKTADNFDAAVRRIFNIHKKEDLLDEFIRFSIHVEENLAHTPSLDIHVANAWMEMDKPQLAKARLFKLNAKQPHARAYYLLAKMAQKEKDWDQVEIYAQKATTLDRENAAYYHLHSSALHQQKKYAHAEEVATKAITYSGKENAWLFNHRAWTRWAQKKYAKALTDWKRAYGIKPDRSAFPYRIAMAYEREGLFKEGLPFIQQAIDLDPDNQKYKGLKQRLETHKQ